MAEQNDFKDSKGQRKSCSRAKVGQPLRAKLNRSDCGNQQETAVFEKKKKT